MGRLLDLTGQHFGKLTVIEFAGYAPNRKTLWRCKCGCGRETIVKTNALRNGETKSCGCLRTQASSETHRKHGMSETRLYRIWIGMKARCLNPNVPCFPNYGGRGITVCAEWTESFDPFRDWALANGYRDNLTIDRIDVNGNYCPDNCRWVSMKTQCENRSNNNLLKLDGETQPVSVWAERIGVSADLLYSRKRKGWTDERILKTPFRKKKGI